MGIKSKSNANNTQRNNSLDIADTMTFEEEGLQFENRYDYYDIKKIDLNANQLVDEIKAGSLDMKEFFSRIPKVKVKELYKHASMNLDEIFENITGLYMENDPDDFETELEFAAYFHSKFDIEFFDD